MAHACFNTTQSVLAPFNDVSQQNRVIDLDTPVEKNPGTFSKLSEDIFLRFS